MSISTESWAEEIRAGNVRALARAITAVENRTPEARELLRRLFPHSGRASIIGLTGAPGSGKSTLADQLAREFRRQGRSVGIIAVDPTSPFSGGAILGDRIRMQRQQADGGIYIRSMATRGALGGLAVATAEVALLLDASGREVVLIETVGVGQDEVDIARLADMTLVVLVPGMGDDVQSIKAGIMEIADIFIINKSDRDGVAELERGIRALQATATPAAGAWVAPIVKTVASEGRGTAELAQAIAAFQAHLDTTALGERRRIENWRRRLLEMLRVEILQRLKDDHLSDEASHRWAVEIAAGRQDPYSIMEEILAKLPLGVRQ
jgi:LAO/AO transport system kinase